MVIYPCAIPMTERQRELVRTQHPDFPYSAMEADLDQFDKRANQWHWHEYFEFSVVHRGQANLGLERESISLTEGEGYFLNANVLHQVRAAPGGGCALMHSQLFDRGLIAGTGLIDRRYVGPIESCAALNVRIFRPEVPEDAAILAELNAAFAAAEGDADGHELRICAHLSCAWELLYRMVAPELRSGGGAPREQSLRLKAMLNFIHENYAKSIRVSDIAAAAGVCERECFRCFTRSLDITPMEYLVRHRVAVASRLLRETARGNAEIASECGFSDAGYFGKVFRRVFGCTPGEYRRQG